MRVLLLAVLMVALAGCGADDWSAPHARPFAVGELGPGFVDPAKPPAPEAKITPRPGSWDAVHPSKDYRAVLLTDGEDALDRTVRQWAQAEDVSLKTVKAEGDAVVHIVEAMDLRPDLIIATSSELVEALELVSASHLDRQFLLLGSELPEPTGNVTAATFFTPERAAPALRAGVAAVLTGWRGIVVRV